jgi:hypothetical protein
MANEVIKIITESGVVLSGKMLVINIYNNTINTFSLKKEPVETIINEVTPTLATV